MENRKCCKGMQRISGMHRIPVIAMVMLLALAMIGCDNGNSEPGNGEENHLPTLNGTISLSPSFAAPGTVLNATYNGTEEDYVIEWKRDGRRVTLNRLSLLAEVVGTYTVTVSMPGYQSKVSNEASVFVINSAHPIINSIYSADPSAHVWPAWNAANSSYEPRLFLYPSQDKFPANGCDLMDGYHVFSTNNMVDWIDHGEILKRNDLPENLNGWGAHHSNAYFMWAPDATYREGVKDKDGNPIGPYFFYFPHATGPLSGSPNWGETWKIGVVWSDNPYSGFDGSKAVILKGTDGQELTIPDNNGVPRQRGNLIDPCIFVDTDDKGNKTYYFMTGGSQQCRIAKLSDDMFSIAEPLTELTSQLPRYHEGPWMFTRKNAAGVKVYYLMYPGHNSSGLGGDMTYAWNTVGPKGPWTGGGSILDPVGTGDTTHGSIVEFNGKWYMFYHNALKSAGRGNLRSVCVDEVFFNPDGTIQRVKQTAGSVTLNGPAHDAAQETKLNALFGAGTWNLEAKFAPPPPPPPPPDPEDYEVDARYHVTDPLDSGTQAPNVTVGTPATLQNEIGDWVVGHFGGAAYLQFTGVNGRSGGEAVFELEYASDKNGSVTVTVNNNSNKVYELSCPRTGQWTKPYSKVYLRIELQAGDNIIKIGGSDVNIRSMAILFLK